MKKRILSMMHVRRDGRASRNHQRHKRHQHCAQHVVTAPSLAFLDVLLSALCARIAWRIGVAGALRRRANSHGRGAVVRPRASVVSPWNVRQRGLNLRPGVALVRACLLRCLCAVLTQGSSLRAASWPGCRRVSR